MHFEKEKWRKQHEELVRKKKCLAPKQAGREQEDSSREWNNLLAREASFFSCSILKRFLAEEKWTKSQRFFFQENRESTF